MTTPFEVLVVKLTDAQFLVCSTLDESPRYDHTIHVRNNNSCKLLPCDFTLVNFTSALTTGVAAMSNLAELRVRNS